MIERIHDAAILATNVTFETYLEQFAGQYAEWVNGTVIGMSPIDRRHDELSRFLSFLLELFLNYRPVATIRAAPTTMRLRSDLPAREPDLQIILDEHADRLTDTYVDGPADWVIEIVSPESVARDRGEKFHEYERGGVNEYWIVDPHRQQLLAYSLGSDGLYTPIPEDQQGRIASVTLPEFRLKVEVLWQSPLPGALARVEMVRAMVET